MLDVDVSGVLQPPGEEDVLHLKVEDLDESFIRFKEDSTVRELFASGRNLLEYIRSYELSIDELEEKSVLETIRNLDHVGILYHEITNCETIVNDLEEEIRGFRTSLTHAAQEMQSLRGRTLTTAQHSNNRRELSARLTDIQEKLHIPETLLESLAVDEINTDYMCYLRQLEQHMRYMNEYGLLDMAVTRNEVWPRVESAIANVSTRLQAHIAKRLGQLQDEGTNISIVQQAIATSCSFANYFVGEYSPQSYTSLCSEYRDVMGRVYLNHTRAYLKEQSKVQASNASRGVRVPAMILIGSSDVFDIHSGKEVSNKKYAITKLAAAAVKLSSVYLSKDSVELEVRDRLYSLRSITGIQGQMFADPSKREAGKAFHTWCDSLLLCFVRLANYMITEKQFELDFFRIPSIPKTSWQDILDGVFTKSTALLDDTLRKELDLNADDIEGMIILARGLDVVQCYFHRNADQANPTLARQLQAWNTCLKEHILALFARNLCSVRDILSCPMQPHRSTHFRNSIAEAVATNPLLEAQLNIHPIVLRYAQFSGPLYFLNTMPLQYSCLDTPIPQSDDGEESTLVREQSSNGSSSASVPPLTVETKCLRNSSSSLDRVGKSTVFEDFIAVSLNSLLQEMRKVITALSRRHTNNVLQLLFLIRNYSGLLHVWDRQESLANLPDYLEVRKALENVMREFVKYELEASAFGKVQEFYDKYNQNVSTPGSRAGGVVVETSQRTYETASAYEDASIVPFNGKPSENMSSVTLSSVAMQEMQTMVLLFHKSWQNTVSTAYETFGKYFGKESDVTIGMMILYFETACNINQKLREMVVAFAPNAPFRSKLVSTQGIRHEMSRYVPARYHAPNTT